MLWLRAVAVWLVLIAAESVHGTLRTRCSSSHPWGRGGLLAFGIIVLVLAPLLADRWRHHPRAVAS